MLHYVIAKMIKTVYHVDVYVPISVIKPLQDVFDNIDTHEVKVADHHLCGFSRSEGYDLN